MKSTLSQQEIAELDEMKAKQTRGAGLSLMSVRDRGFTMLRNGKKMHWHTKQGGWGNKMVQPGYVLIDGVAYSAEELQKFLRWA